MTSRSFVEDDIPPPVASGIKPANDVDSNSAHDDSGFQRDDGAEGAKPGKAQLLADIIRNKYTIVTGRSGVAYLCKNGVATPDSDTYLHRELTGHFWSAHNQTVPAATIKDTISALVGSAINEGSCSRNEPDPDVRITGSESEIVIDLITGEHLVITPGKVSVEKIQKTRKVFRRKPGQLALPVPALPRNVGECHGVLNEARALLGMNAADNAWATVLAWWIAALRPKGPYPILAISGEAGAGKSVTSKLIRNTIDPREQPISQKPKTGQDLAIACNHQHVIAYDNLSGISDEMSDALCTVATMGALEPRALYTGTDLTTLRVGNPIIANGISDLSTRPDLLSRTLPIHLLKRETRSSETEIEQAFAALHPRLLGALAYAMSHAMGSWRNQVSSNEGVRMHEPCMWAMAAEEVLGLQPGDVLRVYTSALEYGSSIAAESPLLFAVTAFMAKADMTSVSPPERYWQGTAQELLVSLDDRRGSGTPPPGWPKLPNVLSGELTRLTGPLRDQGIEIQRKSGRTRKLCIWFRPKDAVD